MSKGAKGRADVTRDKPVRADARAMPSAWRTTLFTALLLLIGYTALTAFKMMHTAPAPASAAVLKSEADVVAARANTVLALSRASQRAATEHLSAAPERPLDAVEAALAIGQASIIGGAVLSGTDLVAVKGPETPALWRKAAGLAHGERAWMGVVGGRLLLVGPPTGAKKQQIILDLALAPALEQAPAEHDAALVTSDGMILGRRGGDTSGGENLRDAFGTAANTVRGLTGGDVGPGRTSDGHGLRLAAAATSDDNIMALVAEPALAPGAAGPVSRKLADQVFTLLAPLAAGLLLTLILLRQARKASEISAAQADSERTFRLAVEAARCGVWEWRLDEDEMHMSDVTGAMLGWGGGGVARGSDVIGRIAAEHQERVRQALRGAAQFGGFDVSFRVQKGGDQTSWIDARGQGFEPGADGFGVIIGVALDVTDERNAELRAQQAERRLSDAIDSVSEAFVLWSRHGRLLMCNTNFREFFSLEAKMVKPGSPKHAVERVAELAIKRRGTPIEGTDRGIIEVELNDGRWLQISERRTAEGGWVMTAADISALKNQEAALRQNEEALQSAVQRLEDSGAALSVLADKHRAASAAAEGASQAKSEFLANMSHELRTPLNAINGFSEMMAREMFGPLGDRRYKEYAGDILSSGQHLLALINDILDMSKIEAGKMAMHPEPLDLLDIVEETVRLLRTRADSAGLALTIEVPHDLPEVDADFRALKQILLNLLSNAVKFTPRGGKVRVFARKDDDGAHVVVGIADTGIGIAEADMERLAKPFEQIESQHSKTQQGTGLGLALTKSLVELHGGVLAIDSKSGAGTTVSFMLACVAQGAGVRRSHAAA